MNVLVSISIMVMLTALSIPYFRKYQTNVKLGSAAKSLSSDLRLAQQVTISEQVIHKVVLDEFNNKYNILKIGPTTTTIKTVIFDSGVSFDEIFDLTNNTVSFNSYGGVSEAGQIILTNTDGQFSTINIKPSGYVELAQ